MKREDVLKALEICRRNRADPGFDHEGQGCPSCPYNGDGIAAGMALTCDDLLRDAKRELSEERIFGIPRDHIDKVLDYYQFHQERIDVCIEECSELIKALTKNVRAHAWPERVRVTPPKSRQMIVDEVSDVLICCGMLRVMYNISQDEIDAVVQRKEERDFHAIPRFINDENGSEIPNPEWIAQEAEKLNRLLTTDFNAESIIFGGGESDGTTS